MAHRTNKEKRNMLHIYGKQALKKEFSTLSDWTCSPTQQTTAHVSAAVSASSQSETSSLSIASKRYVLWFKFSFGAKFFKLDQFLFSFVMYSLP